MTNEYTEQAIENAMNEIKRHLRFIYQKTGIHEPPYRIGLKDEKGVFCIDFIPHKKGRK